MNHLEKEKFKPVIDREYVLEDISRAYDYVMKGQKTGNVLIDLKKREYNTT
jgi:NADPH:quinone reductase-like Zn-dependent oxidoreductase